MPVKRQYRVKGTNDFIVLAGIFFFLCIWAVKDAWFPSDKVMKKHPLEITVAAEVTGIVEKVLVDEGDPVVEGKILAALRSDRIAVEFEEAKNAYTEAKKEFNLLNSASQSGDAQEIAAAQEAMDQALAKVDELRVALESMEIKSPDKGEIKKSYISPLSVVEAGDQLFLIDPQDHFYLFNKSLAIFSFLLFWVFLAIHVLGR
ncbi:MAG TPA: efflux RND transporter periplasmic adaptor subunit [Pontiella sp.]|nr:efflux RND transporter periplasmic adaptor subunit [Pontiella sp.]